MSCWSNINAVIECLLRDPGQTDENALVQGDVHLCFEKHFNLQKVKVRYLIKRIRILLCRSRNKLELRVFEVTSPSRNGNRLTTDVTFDCIASDHKPLDTWKDRIRGEANSKG